MNRIERIAHRIVASDKVEETIEQARNLLSGSNRKVTKGSLFSLVRKSVKGLSKSDFDKAWEELLKEKYLVKLSKNTYMWEM